MDTILPQGIASSYLKLKYLTSKLQRTAASIGFVQKALWNRCTPTFAIVKGNFASEDHRYAAVKSILKANLQENTFKLRRVNADLSILRTVFESKHGTGAFKLIHRMASKSLRRERLDSLCTKNKKLSRLLESKHVSKAFSVPIINLSSHVIADAILHYLRYGLNHSFIDKNRHVKLNLLSEFEFLLNQVSSSIPVCQHEDFKHFLRVHSKLFHQNIFSTPDYTYKVLQKLASDPDLVVLSGDKDSSVVIMQRADYVNKLETMIEEGIANGKYVLTEDNTLKDLKSFQDFLTRNFKSSMPLNKIKPTSNQPAFLYGTAKTHKFQNPEEITKDNLKLRPIVSTCGTFYYETAKFLASYLLPLTENEYSIKTTTDFAERLSNRTVDDDEVLVSYDVSSLFTEVPLDETIDHIIHEIYTNNKLPQLSSKLLFRRLLCNVTKNTVFSFNDKLYKQIDGCGMGNPLSPVLANIFMAKLEADVVQPFNPPFYDRYVDDCFSKKKKDEPDALFERLNHYHPNIVFTVEENPDHFLDTAFNYTTKFNCSVFKKPGKLPTHWKSEVPTKWKRNCITGALHRAKRISTDFDKDIKTLETSFINAGYPKRFISHTINNFLNDSSQDDNIIPNFLFEERKKVFIKLPFCGKNEKLARTFIAKLNKFTNFNFIFVILWQTRQIKSLFNNKDKNTHRSKVVYKGDCSCGDDYIGETVRNLAVRIAEHSNPSHTSEPAKHLRDHPSHSFTWRVLSSAHTFHKRRIVEGLMIQQLRPSLNKQVTSYVSKLFPSGIT